MYTYRNVHGDRCRIGSAGEIFVQSCRRKCEDGNMKTHLHTSQIVVRRHQLHFSDYGPADVVFGKMEIKIKL